MQHLPQVVFSPADLIYPQVSARQAGLGLEEGGGVRACASRGLGG
jgi:hypothetical protein